MDTQCFESVTVSEDGKTVTVQAREGDVDEVVMCFSSKWSVKRLVAALPSESAPAALKSDSAFSELPLPLPDTAGATNETVGLAQVDGQSGASPLPTTIAAGLKSVCLEMNALYAHRQQVWEEICNYYNDDSSYGVLTQRDHALQCAFQVSFQSTMVLPNCHWRGFAFDWSDMLIVARVPVSVGGPGRCQLSCCGGKSFA